MEPKKPKITLPAYYADGTDATVNHRETNADGVIHVDREGRHWIPQEDGTAYWVYD